MVRILSFFALAIGLGLFYGRPASAEVRPIIFPVIGNVSYHDDFGAPRSGGRTHEGNDLLGYKGQPLVAAVDGEIRFVAYPQPEWGYAVFLEDEDGYQYRYLHMNNDTPGTDDNNGGGMAAYAPDMVRSYPVVKGQLIGWIGDSGNAEQTTPHLHFEIRTPDGEPFSPFASLQMAQHLGQPIKAPALPNELLPYAEFRGGASLALGEFDGDKDTVEIVTGAGPGGGPHVRVLYEDGTLLSQFFVYDPDNRNGLDVAAGDITGDGIDEIITGSGPGGPPEVKIFSLDGALLLNYHAYGDFVRTGIHIAAADQDGDGKAEVVTGPMRGGGPHVKVFSPEGNRVQQFFAYHPNFRGGVDVAAAPKSDEFEGRIVTGAGPGGGPHVRVYDPFATLVTQFFPYDERFRGGVRVSMGELDTSQDGWEIVTAPASHGGPDVQAYNENGERYKRDTVFEVWWRGGYDIAVSREKAFTSSGQGPRRASVRELDLN